jgi:hypothetical protein
VSILLLLIAVAAAAAVDDDDDVNVDDDDNNNNNNKEASPKACTDCVELISRDFSNKSGGYIHTLVLFISGSVVSNYVHKHDPNRTDQPKTRNQILQVVT